MFFFSTHEFIRRHLHGWRFRLIGEGVELELPICEENWSGKNVDLKESAIRNRRSQHSISNTMDFIPVLENSYNTRKSTTIKRR